MTMQKWKEQLKALFIAKITNIEPLSQLVEEIAIGDYEIKIINNKQVKV